MNVSFDELVSGDGFVTEAVTRREDARHAPRHATARSRRVRIHAHPWPYRRHLALGILTGVLVAAVSWPYALVLWEVHR